jgi:hypothetical protein
MPGTSSEATLIHVRSDEELAWRTRRMALLGADDALAAKVAASDIDLHTFERLLKDGCSLDLAWSITQPLVEPAAPQAPLPEAAAAGHEEAPAQE